MTWPAAPVTVRVPATSANLGPGFDSFGLALSLHDKVRARVGAAGLDVRVTGEGAQTASAGERHLVIRAMRAAFDVIGTQPGGIELLCGNATPHGFGLGSSAAAIVAGVLAARSLAGSDGLAALPDPTVLRLAAELEGHPDNVAACLLGGLTIAWRSSADAVMATRLEPLPELAAVVCLPQQPLATEAARAVLPGTIRHADAAANSARAALLVAALTSKPELLLPGTEDFLHQDYRAPAMPASAKLVARLRAAGLAAVVSGAGPAVLTLSVGDAAKTVTELAGPDYRVLKLAVDRRGAQVDDGACRQP
jgi:homoserine kinase